MDEARHREAERRLWQSVGLSPEERHLHLRRTNTNVRVQEVGEGPTIVFVHGGSISGVSWALLVARLEGFRCVVLDRPGCGLSEPLSVPFADVAALGAFADDLVVDVIDALGLETAHTAGTSFGGYMVLRAAAAHPERIDRVMELGCPIGAPMVHTPMVMRVASSRTLGRLATRMPPTERSVRMMLRQIGLGHALEIGTFSPVAIEWMISLLRDTDTMRNELDANPPFMTPFRGINESILLPASLLAKIVAPAYFLWGEDDPFGGADVARPFVAHLPNAELEMLPDAGHAVWMDDADHVAATAKTFFNG